MALICKESATLPFLEKCTSIDILESMLEYTGRADVVISSFAISDYYVSRLTDLRDKINSLTVILDFSVMNSGSLFMYLEEIADRVCFTQNHSKIILCSSVRSAVAVMSNNATHNDKNEGGIISTEPLLVDFYSNRFNEIIEESAEWS